MNECLFMILSSSLSQHPLDDLRLRNFTEKDWRDLYNISSQQGLGSVVFDTLIQKQYTPFNIPQSVKYQWISKTISTEKYIRRLTTISNEVAEILRNNNMGVLVLKGITFGQYYNNPLHREYGDLDCYIGEVVGNHYSWGKCFDNANNLLTENGAAIVTSDYKHCHIKYKDLNIENHAMFLPIYNDKRLKKLEIFLNELLLKEGIRNIPKTKMFQPSSTFNALFLVSHAFTHFLIEGIKVKHIYDWAAFIRLEQNNVDWSLVYEWYRILGYEKFVNTLNDIAANYLNVEIKTPFLKTCSKYSEKIIDDCFKDTSVYNKNYSLLKSRFVKIRNLYNGRWKFNELYDKSLIYYVIDIAYNYLVLSLKRD